MHAWDSSGEVTVTWPAGCSRSPGGLDVGAGFAAWAANDYRNQWLRVTDKQAYVIHLLQ